jgi:hypothetical protein
VLDSRRRAALWVNEVGTPGAPDLRAGGAHATGALTVLASDSQEPI